MPKASIIYPSNIVDRNGNGGWHRNGKRAYRRAVTTIMQFLQTAKEPRLYHLCFEELESDEPRKSDKTPHETNVAMLNAFVQMAEREGIKLEWFAAREQADATKKDHLHVFMVIDAKGIKVAKLFNQFEDGRVQQFCNAHGVKFAIFAPKDIMGIHGRNVYMALPYQGQGNRETPLGRKRLADALVWLSYAYKARSKPTDDADGQIFPASRPNRKGKQAPTTTEHNESEQHESSTTQEQHILPLGSFPGANQERADSTSSPCMVDGGQRTSPGEDGGNEGSSSPGPQRQSREGDATHRPRGIEMKTLTTSQKYVGMLYERCVDQRLDVDEVRKYLLEHGVVRTPGQVAFELEHVYEFFGYVETHPAKPWMSVRDWDKAIDKGTTSSCP